MEGFSLKDTSTFLPLTLGRTAHDTLQEFIDIDVTAEDLVKILRKNLAYKDLFARFVNQKTQPRSDPTLKDSKPETSPTHRLIGLLGMIGSRNLILALRMHRAQEKLFPVAEDGSLDIKASDYLKRAQEVEDLFVRLKMEYSETAFAAGVYYDWLIRHLSKQSDFKKSLESFCDSQWKRAQRTGLVAYFLSHEIKGVAPKQAMAAGFLLAGGKILLASQQKKFVEFDERMEAKEIPPIARLLLEREAFQFSSEEIGSHSLRYFHIFESLIPAIRNHREPYCLKNQDEAQYRLAGLLYLADMMAQSWKIPADEKDPLFQRWAHPSLRALKVKPAKLIQAMRMAMAAK